MQYKRLTLLCGHYGSGKTNIAVRMALDLAKLYPRVALADLDIVNPYFRSKDSAPLLEQNGIRLICSEFANSNVDLPALPQDIYTITDDRGIHAVMDIGGDERGALALGRLAPAITEENDYEMLMVINRFRPLTPDAESVAEVFSEIENTCRIPLTGLINNSNLGRETTPELILSSAAFAESTAERTGLPVRCTAVSRELMPALEGKIPNLLPLDVNHYVL